MERVWREFAIRLALALLAGAVTFAVVSAGFLIAQRSQNTQIESQGVQIASQNDEISRLREQVAAGDRQTECRARIANAAETIRVERDSLGWQSLVAFVAGMRDDMADRAHRMNDLDRRLTDATVLRSRAIDICAKDPGFTPP